MDKNLSIYLHFKTEFSMIKYIQKFEILMSTCHLHFGGAIISVAQSCWKSNYHSWAEIAKNIKIFVQKSFVVDDSHNNEVEVNAFDTHPCKGSQEEVM